MAEENHKPRNTISFDGIPPRSRVLDAIPSNVSSQGFPGWIQTRLAAIDDALGENFAGVASEVVRKIRGICH